MKVLALVSFPFQSQVPHLLEPSSSEKGVLPEQSISPSDQSEGGVVTVDKTSTIHDCHTRDQRYEEGRKTTPSSVSTLVFMCCSWSTASPLCGQWTR